VFRIISQRRFVQFFSVLLSPFSFVFSGVLGCALITECGSPTNALKNDAALSACHGLGRCFSLMKRGVLSLCHQLQIVYSVISFIAVFMMQLVTIRNFSPVSPPKIMVQQCVRTVREFEISVLKMIIGLSVKIGVFGNPAHLVCSRVIPYLHVIVSSYVKYDILHMTNQGESHVY
jgi:hypothetical protein